MTQTLPAGVAAPRHPVGDTPDYGGGGATPAGDVNARVGRLMRAGHSWMPLQTLYALADSGLSDQEILDESEAMRKAALTQSTGAAVLANASGAQRKALRDPNTVTNPAVNKLVPSAAKLAKGVQKADDGFKVFFDDPVLQKHPSAALALKQYLAGAIGPYPVTDQDLPHIQQQLQIQGFGRDLKADGTWNPGWDAAQAQWKDAVYQRQLGGERAGGMSVNHALEALQALTPVSAWNSLVGFVKNLPNGARQLLGDVAGGVSGAAYMVTQEPRVPFFSEQSKGEAEHFGRAAADVVNTLGGNTTAAEQTSGIQHDAGLRILEDASNIIMLASVMGSAGRFADAIGTERAAWGAGESAKLGADAAYRGPGVIADSLGKPIVRAGLGGVLGAGAVGAAGGSGGQIALGAVGGAALGGLSTTNVFQNIPILGRTGPVIDSLADADGLYYKARRLVATPYQLAPVRLADQAFQSSLLLGAEARGLAQLQDYVGGDQSTAFSKAVEGEHTLDTVNDAIKHRLDFTVLGAHIAPSLDDLMFLFSGKGAEALGQSSSAHLGAGVDGAKSAMENTLGEVGAEGAIERATNTSRRKLVEQAGGIQNYTKFWANKLKEHAVLWMAEKQRNEELVAAGMPAEESVADLSRFDDLQAKAHAIYQDPAQVREATRGFLAQRGGVTEFEVRLRREITNSRLSPKDYMRQNIQQFLGAGEEAKRNLLPHVESFIDKPEELLADGTPAPRSSQDATLLNASGEPGGFGLARLDTLSRQQALRTIRSLQEEWDAAVANVGAHAAAANASIIQDVHGPVTAVPEGINPELGPAVSDELDALNTRIGDFLHQEFGVTAKNMPQLGEEKLQAASEMAKRLAVDVFVHPDAAAEIHESVARLRELGYKPVAGTDIGWKLHDSEAADMLTGPLTWRRKLAGHLGIDPSVVEDKAIASLRRDGIRNAIQDGIDKGRIRLPPWETPDSMLAYLQADGVLPNTSSPFKGALQELFRVPQRLAKREGMKTEAGLADVDAARADINQALQLRDLPRRKVIEALTDPERWANAHPASATAANVADTRGLEEQLGAVDRLGTQQVPPMSRPSAEAFYAAMVRGSAAPRGYMLGASRIEDIARASMGFAGNGIAYRAGAGALLGGLGSLALDPDHKIDHALEGAVAGSALTAMGGDRLGWALGNLPNKLVQLRNEFRFELSPYFSLRRVAKTNAKMAAEGITPVLDPFKAMVRQGTLNEDRDILERIQPARFNKAEAEGADDAIRYLQAQDVFGLYNGRDYEAYAAGHWSRQGLSDEEINDKLVHTFEYGTKGVAGRSAMERTTNFIFFPFSFDKTLYRNLGSYLLDKPAQRLLLTRAMAAYDEFNRTHMDGSNPLATSFYAKHAPLLEEVTQLNAFTHGISLGEPGGINRPLLNVFLPQSWQASDANLSTLKRFVPAVKDFARLYSEFQDQKSILQATGENMWRDFQGIPATWGNPVKSTLTKQEQLQGAFTMQRKWYENYAQVIDHNDSTRDPTQKINFPMSPEWGDYAGEPITKKNIREIIHLAYPEYSPTDAAKYATSASRDFEQYLLSTKGTPLHDYVAGFADNTLRLGRGMNSDKFSGAEVKSYTAGLRAQAVYIAQHDPSFYKLYDRNFRRILGPLEAASGS